MPAAPPAPDALFAPIADAAPQERFCILHRAAAGRRRGAVLHVHAFAEELNKTRRMVSQQAGRLAVAGFDVLLLDLLGCGDSPGQFADGSWPQWLADVTGAARWLRQQSAAGEVSPLWLWGTRFGALLAAAAAPAVQPQGLLFWQPVLDGAQHLHQFLRIADARVGTDRPEHAGSAQALRCLADDVPVDVAGYRIAPALHRSLQGVRLRAEELSATPLVWVESAASAATSAARQLALPQLRHVPAQGPAFWLQVDSEDAPDWWAATTGAMLEAA